VLQQAGSVLKTGLSKSGLNAVELNMTLMEILVLWILRVSKTNQVTALGFTSPIVLAAFASIELVVTNHELTRGICKVTILLSLWYLMARIVILNLEPWADHQARAGRPALMFQKTFRIPVPTTEDERKHAALIIARHLHEAALPLQDMFAEENAAAARASIPDPELDETQREFFLHRHIHYRIRIDAAKSAWWAAHRLATRFEIPLLAGGIREHSLNVPLKKSHS
jgi:hypothetical protein